MAGTRNPSQRIRGQEVSIIITRDGVLEDTLVDVQNFNAELELEIKSQGYLGEKHNRKDDIYNGVKFDLELHLHTQDYFAFAKGVIDRAKRNTPDTVVNIAGMFQFPNGQLFSFLIPDAKFGPIPLNVTARGDYVKTKLQGEADDVVLTPG